MNTWKADTLEELIENIDSDIASSTDPSTYQYYRNLKNRRIVFNDSIGSDLLDKVILPLEEMDNDGTGKPIELLVDTCGGEVHMGFALVDLIEKLKTPTTVRIVSMAMSMGAYIAMAGRNNPNVTTVCTKYSIGLIHAGIVGYGVMNANAAKDLSTFNDKYQTEIIKQFILTHSNITEEKYLEIERKELYMTAEEMLELGIVDAIQ